MNLVARSGKALEQARLAAARRPRQHAPPVRVVHLGRSTFHAISGHGLGEGTCSPDNLHEKARSIYRHRARREHLKRCEKLSP